MGCTVYSLTNSLYSKIPASEKKKTFLPLLNAYCALRIDHLCKIKSSYLRIRIRIALQKPRNFFFNAKLKNGNFIRHNFPDF